MALPRGVRRIGDVAMLRRSLGSDEGKVKCKKIIPHCIRDFGR